MKNQHEYQVPSHRFDYRIGTGRRFGSLTTGDWISTTPGDEYGGPDNEVKITNVICMDYPSQFFHIIGL